MHNYRDMADVFGKMKDYKHQAEYLQKYYTIKDSLFNTDKKVKMTEMEADYEIEKKNLRIAQQEAETAVQKNQRNIFLFSTISVAALLGGLILFYRRIQHKNTILAAQNIQISNQKEELQQLNNVKDRLFSIISHDVRNPLATLQAYLSMNDNPNLPVEKKQRYKAQTQQAVSQTCDMLDNLLIWANSQIKKTTPEIKAIAIAPCINDAVDLVKAQAEYKNIAINTDIMAENATANSNILNIAIRNVLTNAVKFSNANSAIHISTTLENGKVHIAIRDEGVGMSADQLNALMKQEVESTIGTRGEKGSGLGLFLVMELLKKINATLLIQSAPGKGSTITIELPAA